MNRRALLVAIAAALAVIVAWYFLLWSPRQDDLEAARDRTEAAEVRVADLRARLDRLRAAQRDEPRLRAELEQLRTAVPDLPNLGQFILDANDAAVRAGIDFVSISPTPPAAAAPPAPTAAAGAATTTTTTATGDTTTSAGAGRTTTAGSLPAEIKVSFQIRGGYFQVIDFLNRLADMPRLVVVDGLTVGTEAGARLNVTLTARTFVQPSALTTATPTATTTTTTTAPAGGTTTTTTAGAATTTTTTGGGTP